MDLSETIARSHTFLELAPTTEVTVEVLADDEVEVFIGERDEKLGTANGVTLVLGEEALDTLVGTLSRGRDELKNRLNS